MPPRSRCIRALVELGGAICLFKRQITEKASGSRGRSPVARRDPVTAATNETGGAAKDPAPE